MGLLLGDTVQTDVGETITHIWRAIPQVRNDRRKVRISGSAHPTTLHLSNVSTFNCSKGPSLGRTGSCSPACLYICLICLESEGGSENSNRMCSEETEVPWLVQDRVECSAAQMAEVAQQAEQITQESGRTTRVVGWYHSHPHITVLPSHIDVDTQACTRSISLHAIQDPAALPPGMWQASSYKGL